MEPLFGICVSVVFWSRYGIFVCPWAFPFWSMIDTPVNRLGAPGIRHQHRTASLGDSVGNEPQPSCLCWCQAFVHANRPSPIRQHHRAVRRQPLDLESELDGRLARDADVKRVAEHRIVVARRVSGGR